MKHGLENVVCIGHELELVPKMAKRAAQIVHFVQPRRPQSRELLQFVLPFALSAAAMAPMTADSVDGMFLHQTIQE